CSEASRRAPSHTPRISLATAQRPSEVAASQSTATDEPLAGGSSVESTSSQFESLSNSWAGTARLSTHEASTRWTTTRLPSLEGTRTTDPSVGADGSSPSSRPSCTERGRAQSSLG